jgi:DNA topoisomerase-3
LLAVAARSSVNRAGVEALSPALLRPQGLYGRKRKPDASAAPPTPAQPNSVTGTPRRIPYGNKEVALKLGARYRSGGWYAPRGVDLSAFGERGWL